MKATFSTTVPLLFAAVVGAAAERAPMPQPAGPIGFADAVAVALADAKALPPEVAVQTRYLDARHLPPAERRELYGVVCYHVNGLSREAKRVAPRKVTEWLWAVCLNDYRWDAKVWDELRKVNHYFLVKAVRVDAVAKAVKRTVTEKVKKTRQVLRIDEYGQGRYVTEEYEDTVTKVVVDTVVEAAAPKEDFVPAPWLPAADTTALVLLTGSVTPVVRADEFLFQTAAQAQRKGHGYYDFLALTKRADAEKLAALDRKTAEERYRELAAIVPVSGVSPNNRQVFRYATLAGGWWETRDSNTSTDKQNAVANLLDDYKHDAEEIVFTLPNGLPGYYLSDAQGTQVDTAPDTIAVDHDSTNNDRRVHVGYSCIGCHQDAGLKPVRDYARRLYSPETGVGLASVALDPAKARRLESVYLGPLEKAYKRDTSDFGEAIEEASGLKPVELAKAMRKRWSRYLDDPVTLERAAAECGVGADELKAKLRTYARTKGVIDPVLVGYLIEDGPPVRREYFEERFPVLMLILGGATP